MHPLARALPCGLLIALACVHGAPQDLPNRARAPAVEEPRTSGPERRTHEECRDLLARAQAARQRGELEVARAEAVRAVDRLTRSAPTPLSPAEDQLLLELGSLAHDLGELGTARAARERVVLEREARLPPDHHDLAVARLCLSNTLAVQGDLQAARALQERVLEVFERTLPPDDSNLAAARMSLATTLFVLGDDSAARDLLEGVVEVLERTLPPDHPQLAAARGNLGNTLFNLGELSQARALFERVLEVSERTLPPDHIHLATARASLANTLFSLGDLVAARALQERVLEVLERTLPADHPHVAMAQGNLASTLRALGELPAARALQEHVLRARERTLPPDHPDLALARGNLANTLKNLGDLQGARALQERVLEVRERTLPADHPDVALALMSLGNTLQAQGEWTAARALLERALEVFESALPPDHPLLAAARGNLANTLVSLEDFSAARELFERVLEVGERTLPPDHPDLVRGRGNLAVALLDLGEVSAARAMLERVVEAWERTLPDDHPHLNWARGTLALTLGALLADGAEEERVALVTLALDYTRGLRRMAQEALLDGSPREVEERLASQAADLANAISLSRSYGDSALGPEITREVFLLGESTRAGGPIASRLAARAGNDGVGRDLRARIAESTAELAGLAQSGGSAEELGRARTAVDLSGRDLARHAAALLGGAAPLEPSLAALTQGLAETDALVAWRRTALTSVEGADPSQWHDVDSLVAFVLRPSESSDRSPQLEFVDLGPIAPIEAAIDRWRVLLGVRTERGLAPQNDTAAADDAARDVRQRILDPLRSALMGVERIVVVLDGALHTIPLDALPAGDPWGAAYEPGKRLGDVLRIDVRSSLIEMLLPVELLVREPTLLALGHPAFDADPASVEELAEESGPIVAAAARSGGDAGLLRGGAWERGFGTLPETRAEVRGILQYFQDAFGENAPALLLERRKASREALVEFAPRARWLHVATHGWFAPESVRSSLDPSPGARGSIAGLRMDEVEHMRGMSPMLLCGLALSGANLPMNGAGRIPGLVTAQELSALDLSNCELSVLSACDTNVGLRRAGQGVASLQKALQMAGARSVITSLWRVSDEATKELMVDFYRRLWVERKPKHQALWEAKTKLRNETDERGGPRYTTRDWAAWVLSGEPN